MYNLTYVIIKQQKILTQMPAKQDMHARIDLVLSIGGCFVAVTPPAFFEFVLVHLLFSFLECRAEFNYVLNKEKRASKLRLEDKWIT